MRKNLLVRYFAKPASLSSKQAELSGGSGITTAGTHSNLSGGRTSSTTRLDAADSSSRALSHHCHHQRHYPSPRQCHCHQSPFAIWLKLELEPHPATTPLAGWRAPLGHRRCGCCTYPRTGSNGSCWGPFKTGMNPTHIL